MGVSCCKQIRRTTEEDNNMVIPSLEMNLEDDSTTSIEIVEEIFYISEEDKDEKEDQKEMLSPGPDFLIAQKISDEIVQAALEDCNYQHNVVFTNFFSNVLHPAEGLGNQPILRFVIENHADLYAGVRVEQARQLYEIMGDDLAYVKILSASLEADAQLYQDSDDEKHLARGISSPLLENLGAQTCPVCFDQIDAGEGFSLRDCDHFFCKNCFQGYINGKISEGEDIIECLLPDCHHAVTHRELMGLIGSKQFEVLGRRMLENVVASDNTLHLCPTADCTFVVSWTGGTDGEPFLKCPLCEREHCLICGEEPYHFGRQCEIHEEDEELIAYLKSAGIRICPKCGNAIVKSYGCNKLKCRCGARFCYECGSPNAQCGHTPARHGFVDNLTGRGDFTNLEGSQGANY